MPSPSQSRPLPAPPCPFAVAMAASAGGLEAFSVVLGSLPARFPAPVLLVMHLEPHRQSLLAELLRRRTPLQVIEAREGMPLEPGQVLVGPPDRHLLVSGSRRVHLGRGVPVHFVRPSADELFFSLAAAYGDGAIGVVCTGGGLDGAAGLRAIQAAGGVTVVQEPATSAVRGMPDAAVRAGAADLVLPLEDIAPRLVALVQARS